MSYHYIILKDWQVLNLRPENQEGRATKNNNYGAIQIALEGNFEIEKPTDEQYEELAGLIKNIRSRYGNIKAYWHGDLESEHTRCAGKLFSWTVVRDYLDDAPIVTPVVMKRDAFNRTNPTWCHVFKVTRYYSPLPNQPEYAKSADLGRRRTYAEEIKMQGNGTHTSTWFPLSNEYAYKVAACPIKSWSTRWMKLRVITTLWERIVECRDTGWSIKWFRIDIWAWFGYEALQSIEKWLWSIPDRQVTVCFPE